VSEAQKLRAKALHAREMAWSLSDELARTALEALALEFERRASELEAQELNDQERPASRSDTP
jgi:hypothetical protein